MVRHSSRDTSNYGPSKRDGDTNDTNNPVDGGDDVAGAGKRSGSGGGRGKGGASAKKVVFRPSVRPLSLGPAAVNKAATPPPSFTSTASTALTGTSSAVADGGGSNGNNNSSITAQSVGRLVCGRRTNTLSNGGLSSETAGLLLLKAAAATTAAIAKDADSNKPENPWVLRARRSTAPCAPVASNPAKDDGSAAATVDAISDKPKTNEKRQQMEEEEEENALLLDSAVDFSDDAAEAPSIITETASVGVEASVSPQQIPPRYSHTELDDEPQIPDTNITVCSDESDAPAEQLRHAEAAMPFAMGFALTAAAPVSIGIWSKPEIKATDTPERLEANAPPPPPVSDSAKWWKARISETSRATSTGQQESLKSTPSSRRQSLAAKGVVAGCLPTTSLVKTAAAAGVAGESSQTLHGAKSQRGSRRHQAHIPTVVPPLMLARATATPTSLLSTSTTTAAASTTIPATTIVAAAPVAVSAFTTTSTGAGDTAAASIADPVMPTAAATVITSSSLSQPPIEPKYASEPPPANESIPANTKITESLKDDPIPATTATVLVVPSVDKQPQAADQTAKKRTTSTDTKYADNWRSRHDSKTPTTTANPDKAKTRKPQQRQSQVQHAVSSSSLSSDSAVELKPRQTSVSVHRRGSVVAKPTPTPATISTSTSTNKPAADAASWRSDPSRARRSQSVAASTVSSAPKQQSQARQPLAGVGSQQGGDQFASLMPNIPPPTAPVLQYRGVHASFVVPSSTSSSSSSPQVHGVAAASSSLSSNHHHHHHHHIGGGNHDSNTIRSQQPLLPHTMLADILDDNSASSSSGGAKNQQSGSIITNGASLFNPAANHHPLLSPPDTAAVASSSRGNNYSRYSESMGNVVAMVTSSQLGPSLRALSSGVNQLWIDPSVVGGTEQDLQPLHHAPNEPRARSRGDAGGYNKGPARLPPQPIGTRSQRTNNVPQNQHQQQQQQQQQQWNLYHPADPMELGGQYKPRFTSGDIQANQIPLPPQYMMPSYPQNMMMVPAMHIPLGMHVSSDGYPAIDPNISNNASNNGISSQQHPSFLGMMVPPTSSQQQHQQLLSSIHHQHISPPQPMVYPAYGYAGGGGGVQPSPYVSYPPPMPLPHRFNPPHIDYMGSSMQPPGPPGYGTNDNTARFYCPPVAAMGVEQSVLVVGQNSNHQHAGAGAGGSDYHPPANGTTTTAAAAAASAGGGGGYGDSLVYSEPGGAYYRQYGQNNIVDTAGQSSGGQAVSTGKTLHRAPAAATPANVSTTAT
ncbi:hypothetical protein H4217_005233 [Coemansia sp. RSA 1939]|nr:hypothetical protein H4217_005233 [Coemansia sp. RSA 1939]